MFIISHRSLPPAVSLTRKLVSVLESIEKLPLYVYDTPSSGYGLQVCLLCVSLCVSHSVFTHCMVLVYIQLIAILSFAMLVTRFIRFMEIFT